MNGDNSFLKVRRSQLPSKSRVVYSIHVIYIHIPQSQNLLKSQNMFNALLGLDVWGSDVHCLPDHLWRGQGVPPDRGGTGDPRDLLRLRHRLLAHSRLLLLVRPGDERKVHVRTAELVWITAIPSNITATRGSGSE